MDLPAGPLQARVGVFSLSSPLEVGAGLAPSLATDLCERLQAAGLAVVPAGSVDTPDQAAAAGRLFAEHHVDALAAVAASWFEDYLVLDLLEECPAPLLLWSTPGMETGALCGTQQLTCYLRPLAHPYDCAFGDLADDACLTRALDFLRAAALQSRLRRARIGLAGSRIGGMTHTSPADITLSDVRLMGQGVCALFPARPGPVTLLSLNTTAAGYQAALLEGEALPAPMVFPGNPVRVQFPQPTSQLIDWIHQSGIGHHWMIGQGHHGAALRRWAKLAGPALTWLEP